MKVEVTREWIYLNSETEREAKRLKGFIWGDKKRGIPRARMLFVNGTRQSTNEIDVGIAIRKVSEVELDIECMQRLKEIEEKRTEIHEIDGRPMIVCPH